MDAFRTDRVTEILIEAEAPTGRPLDRLIPLVYDELHELASRELQNEQAAHTLSPTALVHEAYLRLARDPRITARGRAYFFAAGAQAMRRIVVEHARRRNRQKRGGGARPLTLDTGLAADRQEVDVLDLERGLDALAAIAARSARVVECRYYAGLTVDETALALNVTARTVKRDWAFARAWLFDFLNAGVDA